MKKRRVVTLYLIILIVINFLLIGFISLFAPDESRRNKEGILKEPAPVVVGTSSSGNIFKFYSNYRSDFAPLRIVTLVGQNGGNYDENFAYLAAVPMSLYNENNVLKVSPLLYDNLDFTQENFLQDWKNYTKIFGDWEGVKNIVYIGNITEETKANIEDVLNPEAKANDRIIGPIQITGQNTYDIAAAIATYFWYRPDTIVIAPINETFPNPRERILTYSNVLGGNSKLSQIGEINSSSLENSWSKSNISLDSGGIFAQINNTNELAMDLFGNFSQQTPWMFDTNQLTKQNWIFFPNVSYPASIADWGVKVYNTSIVVSPIHYMLNFSIFAYQTYQIQINNSESNFEITLNWSSVTDDLNFWLLDPTNQLIEASSRRGNLYESGNLNKSASVLYPARGNWTIVVTRPTGTIPIAYNLTVNITEYSSYRSQCIESAANGAIIASSLNKPLLYVTNATIPNATRKAISILSPSKAIIVDPFNLVTQDVLDNLFTLNVNEFINLTSRSELYEYIYNITHQSDIVLSSMNDGNFAPATLLAAFHGAPLLSSIDENYNIHMGALKNYAIDRWIGFQNPGDSALLGQDLPRFQDMKNLADTFYTWLNTVNLDKAGRETLLIVSPITELNPYFDRAVYGKTLAGRFTASNTAELATYICRNIFYPTLSYTNLAYRYESSMKSIACSGNATITSSQLYATSFSGNFTACQSNDDVYHTYFNATNGAITMAYYVNLTDSRILYENISQIEIMLNGKIGYTNSSIKRAGWGIWNWSAGTSKIIDEDFLNSTIDQSDTISIDSSNISSFLLPTNARIEIFILVNTTGPSVNASIDFIQFNVTYNQIINQPAMISSSVSYWHNFTFQGEVYNFSSAIPMNFTQYGYSVENTTGYLEIFSKLAENSKLWYYSGNSTLPLSSFGGKGNMLFSEADYWRAYGDYNDNQGSSPENPDADGDHIVTANTSIGKWQTGGEINNSLGQLYSPWILLQDSFLGGTQIPEYLIQHGAAIIIAGLKPNVLGYSEYLSYIFLNNLLMNEPCGEALYDAFNQTSHLYSLGWEGDIRGMLPFSNYTEENQQFIIYGDPELHFINTTFDLPYPASYRPLLHEVSKNVTRSSPGYIEADITDLDSELGTQVGALFNVTGVDYPQLKTNIITYYASPPPHYEAYPIFFDNSWGYPWESLGQKTLEWLIYDSTNVIRYYSPIELVTQPPTILVTRSKTQFNESGTLYDIDHWTNIFDLDIYEELGRVNESLYVAFNVTDLDQDPTINDWEEFNVTLILTNVNDSSTISFPMQFQTDGDANDVYSYWTYHYTFNETFSIGRYYINARIEDHDGAIVENAHTGYDIEVPSNTFIQWFNLINWMPEVNGTEFLRTNGTGALPQVFRVNETLEVNATVFDIDGFDQAHVQNATVCFYRNSHWINITMQDSDLDDLWNVTYKFTQFNEPGVWDIYLNITDKDNLTVLFKANTNITVVNIPPETPRNLKITNLTQIEITSVFRNVTILLFGNTTDQDAIDPTGNLTLYACLKDPSGILRYQEVMTYDNETDQWEYNFTPQTTDTVGNWTYYVSAWDQYGGYSNSTEQLILVLLNNIPIIQSVDINPTGGTLNFGEPLWITGEIFDVESLDYIQVFIEDENGDSVNLTQSMSGDTFFSFGIEFTDTQYSSLEAGKWNITIKLVDTEGDYTNDFSFESQNGVITITVLPKNENKKGRFPIEIVIIIAIVVTTVLATYLVYRTRRREATVIPAARVKQIIKKISKEREAELTKEREEIKTRIKPIKTKPEKTVAPAPVIQKELTNKERDEINKKIQIEIKKAQEFLEKELYDEAALAYHDAAKWASRVEKYEMARVYSEKGEEILQKRAEILREKKKKPKIKKKKKRKPEEFLSKEEIETIKSDIGEIMRSARKAIREEDYISAAKKYQEVAKLYRKIQDEEKALYFEEKAEELF
ncbi:MAG: hypothetical protein ACTSQI_02395 [Candidatus Helarchaeota archaeon]